MGAAALRAEREHRRCDSMAKASGVTREGARWIGHTIAHRYRIEAHVARGGMGDVYLAIQEPLGRRVAVKTFRTLGELDGHADADALFLREAAAIAEVRHENAVEIYDYGTHEGTPFLVMEWLDGVSLARTLDREGCLSPPRALRMIGKVLGALERAHEVGMVHRDVKPENIMLAVGKTVKLVDFGLVKWDTHGSDAYAVDGVVVGSPRYMAPEQIIDSRRVDHRADLYAIGGVLVHMLTGAPPFAGSNADLFRQHVRSTPPALCARGLPASDRLEAVVERCLAKSPDDRFGTAGQLLDALRSCPEWDGEIGGALPRESNRPAPRAPRARPRPARVGLALASVLAAVYLGLWATTLDAPPIARQKPTAAVRPVPLAAPSPPDPIVPVVVESARSEPAAEPPVTLLEPAPTEPAPALAEPAPAARSSRRRRRAKQVPTPAVIDDIENMASWSGTRPCDPIKDPWANEPPRDELGAWTKAQ